jgi:hypothetical protein
MNPHPSTAATLILLERAGNTPVTLILNAELYPPAAQREAIARGGCTLCQGAASAVALEAGTATTDAFRAFLSDLTLTALRAE